MRFGLSARELTGRAVDNVVRTCSAVTEQAGVSIDDVDWVLLHQANGSIMDAFLKALDIPESRSIRVVRELGSLGAAGVAVALDRLLRTRPVKEGDLVLIASVGAGAARGAVLFRMGER